MATPHVVGVAALYLEGTPAASPATVSAAINANATTGKVASAGSGSPNRLLYADFSGGPPPPPPSADSINLTVTPGGKSKNQKTSVALNWTGATGAVQVTRNSSVIASSVSGSTYTDSVRSGTYSYQVCRTDLTVCSNEVSVTV